MKSIIRRTLQVLVCINIVAFLGLAQAHWFNMQGDAAVLIDFYGRWTVYSLWFIGYELYRNYL